MFKKSKKLFVFFIILLFAIFIFSRGHIYEKDELEYGVTFSFKQAKDMGLDWQQMYLAILDDLGVKKLRLSAYWDEIEPVDGQFNWEDIDWQINEASKRDAQIILAIGGRLPRWPECHFPEWTKELTKGQGEEKILNYLNEVVLRYRDNEHIIAWQVENEPFLTNFGECPKYNKSFLDSEITQVRNLDSRPIVITDSGELSIWIPAARRADIFGTTMYRDTYSKVLKRYIHYPITSGFFRFKRNITSIFASPKKWIVIELQAEPWGPAPYYYLTKQERDRTMNLAKFREILEFSRQAGFKEFYLWGVEWWYWEKVENNDNSLWEEVKGLF